MSAKYEATAAQLSARRVAVGSWLQRGAALLLLAIVAVRALKTAGLTQVGFADWRPILYAYVLFCVALGAGQILKYGEREQIAFLLPAFLFTAAMVIFPNLFGLGTAFTDWNLNGDAHHNFIGLANLRALWEGSYFWKALGNMAFYVGSVAVQYAIAFGVALLLNADIGGRKLFRVAFQLPFMLSPVAISWMFGRSMMENRFGPVANFFRFVGWDNPAFFSSPGIARTSFAVMESWQWIPFMIIMRLAGLQALPHEVKEAAKVDGATAWQAFWGVTFPLMLPVSVTTVVLRVIFELKLADIVINVTSGGPGGATDTISSFVYREYRDRCNVGYATMVAEVYLVLIIVFVTLLLRAVSRFMQRMT